MAVCTFAGHRNVFGGVSDRVVEQLEKILSKERSLECLVGGMGEFDSICTKAVQTLKREYPARNISLTLVLPYMSQKLNDNKQYFETVYDNIIIPEELYGVHYKQAITARNKWMIDRSDYLIAMIRRDFGGAYTSLKYAQEKRLTILQI